MATDVMENEAAAGCLKRPYARVVVPETDGTFRAEILEFPGCIATGDSAAEALTELEEVAVAWLSAALAQGQKIPEPLEAVEFSGRLVLRMPRSLHKKAARLAEREGVSLNQLIVTSLAEHVGASSRAAQMTLGAGATVEAVGILAYADTQHVVAGLAPQRVQHRHFSSGDAPTIPIRNLLSLHSG